MKKHYQEVLAILKSITEKRYCFFRTTFLFYRFREGVQEGYVKKEGIVDTRGIF